MKYKQENTLTNKAPLHLVCDSAHDLFFQVLQAFSESEVVSSVRNSKSVGSFWGMVDRPTKELRYVTFVLENPRDRLINASYFLIEDIIPRTLLCTLSDEIDLQAIGFYNSRAFEFSDDGRTVSSNYGYRVRHLGNVDQIQEVIRQLQQDPNSRRAVIHIHAVGDSDIKYSPCIDSLHFLIRNGALECQSLWRSENAVTLLPINIFEFTMLQELIASELEIPVGRYVHTVTSLHYYLDEEKRLHRTLEELAMKPRPEPMGCMPYKSLREIELLRGFEKIARCHLDAGSDKFLELSDYWKNIADVITCAVVKKEKACFHNASIA